MKKIIELLLCLILAMAIMTACNDGAQNPADGTGSGEEHTHTFEEAWTSDGEYHWHRATCDHYNEMSGKALHVDADGNEMCDVCGQRIDHVHTFATTWTITETHHYYKNTCGEEDNEKYRKDYAEHIDANNDAICDTCGYDYAHTHTYAEEWTKTEGGHWHLPTCDHDVPGSGLTDHVDADNDSICDGCGYDYDHTHTYATAWTTNDDKHWHEANCNHNAPVLDEAPHADANGDGTCDVCGAKPEHFHTFAPVWTGVADGHYHKAICGHDLYDTLLSHDGYEDGICDTCMYVKNHEHTYDKEWTKTEGGHWHLPICGHETAPGSGFTVHVDTNNDSLCDDCGYDYGHTHTYAEEWSTSSDKHWREVTCGHSIPAGEEAAHVNEDGDEACDICGYEPPHFHSFEQNWSSTADGHFHKANCGHDLIDEVKPHDGYEVDGQCDTCGYIFFYRYTVTVKTDKDDIAIRDVSGRFTPDSVTDVNGKIQTTYILKEGTELTLTLTLPYHVELVKLTGGTFDGDPVADESKSYHTYTLKIPALSADTEISMSTFKKANVEIIVEDGLLEVEVPKTWKNYTGKIIFTAPTAGRYVIFSQTHAGEITFATPWTNTVEQDEASISYEFDVTVGQIGEITLDYSYFAMNKPQSGVAEIHYTVIKVDAYKTLDALEGSGYTMPANATVNLTFTVPSPGLYQITSSYPIAWNGDVTQPYVFQVKEGELSPTISMHYKTGDSQAAEPSFSFDWKIEPLGGENEVGLGTTPVTAPLENYYGVIFTPDRDGRYHFALSDPNMAFYNWHETWIDGVFYDASMNPVSDDYLSAEVKAGTPIKLYIRVNLFGYGETPTEDVHGNLTITYIPPKSEGGYLVNVGETSAFYHTGKESEFHISVPAGAEISFDGGETWHTELEMVISPDTLLFYQVRSDSETVLVSMERIVYGFNLAVGKNTVTMIPGKEYEVTLSGSIAPNHYTSYILEWSDANITVEYRGNTIVPGGEIDAFRVDSHVIIVYNGKSESKVSFTLKDNYDPADDSGILINHLDGRFVVNSEDRKGLYTLDFDLSAMTLIIQDNNTGALTGTFRLVYANNEVGYSVTDINGEAVEILLSTNQEGQFTFQCVGLRLPLVMERVVDDENNPEPDVNTLVLGNNSIEVEDGHNGVSYTYTATTAGTYILTNATGETNAYISVETATFLDNGVDFPYNIQLAAGETVTFIIATKDENPDTIDLVWSKA